MSEELTRIGAGLRIEGELVSEGAVRIEGAVAGGVRAASVRIEGEVEGDVVATGRVELGSAARVRGDVSAERVVISDGARLSGKVEMHG